MSQVASTGLESFREVSEFVPLRLDRQGKVTREVALARFSLPLPEHPGQELDLRVALIRDLCRQVPDEKRPEDEDGPRRWDEKPDGTHEYWLDASWQATPMPAPPRSEEHTSELQSRVDLVCRLLLEKKKRKK